MTSEAKHGTSTRALFSIQIFATLSFAVLYSSIVLFITQGLHLDTTTANEIMGNFIAFNYGLHLLGGYFGGRHLSYRNLFVLGIILQVVGCAILALTTQSSLYWGLAFFLTGSGLNVTCINMMVTQLFAPEDKRRESAFIWNYSGMNIGFFLGFSMAGYFQLSHAYNTLFILCSISGLITLMITAINWKVLCDRNTPLTQANAKRSIRALVGLTAIILMVPILRWLLDHASFSNQLVLIAGGIMLIVILLLAVREPFLQDKLRIFAYLIFAVCGLIFWTLYQIAPMGLTVFTFHNVDRHVFGMTISPQWIQNVNSLVIIFGGPIMILLLKRVRKFMRFSIPLQFSFSMLYVGIGFLLLPIGIHYAAPNGLINIDWVVASYVFQSIAELLISPIGYAMIGLLAPANLQGILMGSWMLMTGIAGMLASYCSNYAIANVSSQDPLITNPGYSHTFALLGWLAVGCGVTMLFLVPVLRRFINEKSHH